GDRVVQARRERPAGRVQVVPDAVAGREGEARLAAEDRRGAPRAAVPMILVQLAINGLLLGGLYLLMAQGLNLVFGVMKIVNFAHGALIVVAGLVVYRLNDAYGLNPLLGVLIVAPAFFAIGALLHRLLIERIRAAGAE